MSQRDRVRLDCPFLEAGKCTVYEVRPIACRGYSSYSVEDCREDYEHPGTGVEIHTNGLRELVYGAIREGLAIACKSASVEHRLLELVRAYKIASEDPTLVGDLAQPPRRHSKPRPGRAFSPARGRMNSTGNSRRCTGRPSISSNGIGGRFLGVCPSDAFAPSPSKNAVVSDPAVAEPQRGCGMTKTYHD